jgi:hypothetical protein
MAPAARCPGCGADLPPAASYCPRCGRSTTPALRELERIDGVPAVPIAHERTVSESGGGGSRRRGIATVLAILAVLGATVVLLSGGGGSDDDTASAPTTTSRSTANTRLVYPPSTRPGETTTTTTRAPTTTSSTTTSTTVVELLGEAPAPVLGEPTGGRSVYAVGDGTIRRVELDTGRITTIDVSRYGDEWYLADVRGGVLVLTNGSADYEIALDLGGGVQLAERPPTNGYLVVGTADSWTIQGGPFGQVAELRRAGEVIATHPLRQGLEAYGTVRDRLVVAGGGHIYTMDPGGEIRSYAQGTVAGTNGNWVLWWSCDGEVRCRYHLGDVDDADARSVNTPEDSFVPPYYFGSAGGLQSVISPGGTFAVVYGGDGSRVVDLRDGRVVAQVFDGFGGWVWSPDDRWLYRFDPRGEVIAISTVDGHEVEVLPDVGRVQNGPRALAIG